MDTAGREMQNIHPVLQPYLETLTMFWDFEEKKKKKKNYAGMQGIYVYGTGSTGKLYCSGIKFGSKVRVN